MGESPSIHSDSSRTAQLAEVPQTELQVSYQLKPEIPRPNEVLTCTLTITNPLPYAVSNLSITLVYNPLDFSRHLLVGAICPATHPSNQVVRLGETARLKVLEAQTAFSIDVGFFGRQPGLFRTDGSIQWKGQGGTVAYVTTNVDVSIAFAGPQWTSQLFKTDAAPLYNPTSDRLLLTVPSRLKPFGRSVLTMNPTSGQIEDRTPIPERAYPMSLSSDGNILYLVRFQSNWVDRLDLKTKEFTGSFSLPPGDAVWDLQAPSVWDLKAVPGTFNTVVAASSLPSGRNIIRVYDAGVPRPLTIEVPGYDSGADLAFGAVSNEVYYLDRVSTPPPSRGIFLKLRLSELGLEIVNGITNRQLITASSGLNWDYGNQVIQQDYAYLSSGFRVDLKTFTFEPSGLPAGYIATTSGGDCLVTSANRMVSYNLATGVENWAWDPGLPRTSGAQFIGLGVTSNGIAFSSDPSTGNLILVNNHFLAAIPGADLSIRVSPQERRWVPGTQVTIYEVISNAGPRTVSGIRITNLVPAGLKVLSAELSGGSCNFTNGLVVCELTHSMRWGEARLLGIVGEVPSAGQITLQASISSPTVELDPSDNVTRWTNPVEPFSRLSATQPNIFEWESESDQPATRIEIWPPSPIPIRFRITFTEGTAKEGIDFLTPTNYRSILTLLPFQTELDIPVRIFGNLVPGVDRFFHWEISDVENATPNKLSGDAWIYEDDNPGLRVYPTVVSEAQGYAKILMSVPSNIAHGPIRIDYRLLPKTASAWEDFTPTNSVVTFSEGQSFVSLRIPIINDDQVEPTEVFQLVLDRVEGVTSEVSTFDIGIVDDDLEPPSAFGITNVTPNSVRLKFSTRLGDRYIIQRAERMPVYVWENVLGPVLPESPETVVELETSKSQAAFYRVITVR